MSQQSGNYPIGAGKERLNIPVPSGQNLSFFLNPNDGDKLYAMNSKKVIFPVQVDAPAQDGGLPIIRYVYLVQNAADQTRMGGTTAHVYLTAQTAYDAAVVIQAAVGGIVEIVVGNITAALAGDITLTANWNSNVHISGLSPYESNIRNIQTDGFNIDTRLTNVKVGIIVATPLTNPGNGGNITLKGSNYTFSQARSDGDDMGTLVAFNGGNINIDGSGISGVPTENGLVTTSGVTSVINSRGGTVTLRNSTVFAITSGIDNALGSDGNTVSVLENCLLANITHRLHHNTSPVLTVQNSKLTGTIDQVNSSATNDFGTLTISNSSLDTITRGQLGVGSFGSLIFKNPVITNSNPFLTSIIDITGLTTIDFKDPAIILGACNGTVVLSSTNPTETITDIINMPNDTLLNNNHPVKFYTVAPLVVTFVHGVGATNPRCAGGVNAIIGSTEGDFVEFTAISTVSYQTAGETY